MKKTQSDHQTFGGYEYYGLPEIRDEETIATLEEAPHHKSVYITKISQRLFDYLSDKYHFHLEDFEICGQISCIINNREESFQAIKTNIGWTLVCWNDKDSPSLIYTEIFQPQGWVQQGLEKFLDPNYGGSISTGHLDIANLIIFG